MNETNDRPLGAICVTTGSEEHPALRFLDQLVDRDLVARIYDRLDTAVWIFDFDNKRFLWSNRKHLEIMDAASVEELRSRDLSSDMTHAVETRLKQYQQDFTNLDACVHERWTLYPKGQPRVLNIKMSGVRLMDNRLALLCEATEAHVESPNALRSSEAVLYSSVMISLYTMDGKPLYRNTAARASCSNVNEAFQDRFLDPGDAGVLLARLEKESDVRMVARVLTGDGDKWHELTLRACFDAVTGLPAFVVSESDVTALQELKERAEFLASHDPLTGLANRSFLEERVEKLLEQARRAGKRVSCFLIDLDDFKAVNDTMGHHTGDRLLVTVSETLRNLTLQDDIVARLGGDEFLICSMENGSDWKPETLGERILWAFRSPQTVGESPRFIKMSIGHACFPGDGAQFDDLMRNADIALYQAKQHPTRRLVRYREGMRHVFDLNADLENDLRLGLERGEFSLVFQPVVNTVSGEISAAEALVRWHHPKRGLVMPDDFIRVAEDTGLIGPLGTWVCTAVGRFQRQLQDNGIAIPLSLNVSPCQLTNPQFLKIFMAMPDLCRIEPGTISLEITENILLGDVENTRETLNVLKNKGYRIVVDDFGTGYSNLAYLHHYPIDVIKIDRTFINDIGSGGAILRMIVSLASVLGADVIAEGVETEAQRQRLVEIGCHWFQGYLYSPPVDMDRFMEMLKNGRAQARPGIIAANR